MAKHKFTSESVDRFFDAILTLNDREECYRFFSDIATIPEIRALAQRLEVAQLLSDNETYSNISQITGVSPTTICRVKNCLLYGSEGYKMVLDRLAEAEETDA